MKKLHLALLLSVPFAASSLRAEETSYLPEPLLMRSESLAQLFRSSPYAQRYRLGEVGDGRVSIQRSYANFWGHDKRYIVDAETRDDVLRFHYQPAATYEVYGALSERAFTRSGTDGLAIAFHNTFGLPQDGRLDAPRSHTRVAVPDFNLNYTNADEKNILSRQIEAGVVYDLDRGFDLGLPMTLSLFASYETATGNPYFTHTIDGGMRLSSAYNLGNAALFGSLSLGIFDQKQKVQIASYEQQWGGLGGASYRFFDRHEVLAQFVMYQPLFQNMGQLSRASYEIHAAYRFRYDALSIEVGLIENIFWVYNSPDWGMSLGLSYHFGA